MINMEETGRLARAHAMEDYEKQGQITDEIYLLLSKKKVTLSDTKAILWGVLDKIENENIISL